MTWKSVRRQTINEYSNGGEMRSRVKMIFEKRSLKNRVYATNYNFRIIKCSAQSNYYAFFLSNCTLFNLKDIFSLMSKIKMNKSVQKDRWCWWKDFFFFQIHFVLIHFTFIKYIVIVRHAGKSDFCQPPINNVVYPFVK